jgi:hypothetical protein
MSSCDQGSCCSRLLIAALFSVWLSGCASVKTGFPEPVTEPIQESITDPLTVVFLDEYNQLHYNGYFEQESNRKLIRLYMETPIKPETLIMSSEGGNVMNGIELGEWVYDTGLVVVVDGVCASSCANYVFTAGRQKGLKKDSVIIWHGSSWQQDADELYRQGDPSVIEWRQREVGFFEKIGVDHQITIYGLNRYPFRTYLGAIMTANPIEGFDYSIEDMAKFGVTNVYEIEGEWDWRAYTDCCNVVRIPVR